MQHVLNFSFNGAWLNIGESGQQLHLMELPNLYPEDVELEHIYRDQHVALIVDDIDTLVKDLKNAGIKILRSQSGRPAFFVVIQMARFSSFQKIFLYYKYNFVSPV